ncbi:arrestin domain-containing protein 2-like [Ostrea edulis]|uniref:arrestin domain-containing protein 2-like n=1 Tax=Ostrea edulis TaxID=37623 RepID=UPI0020950513|nr:arrestin domain-containing protein 2-like [Ostrea edulis]XP_048769210.2 arrestin domain-containing protein 2-like [Ostrea edulis]XP_048769216.2 arrestin domain-containing protein 2-like [Ostrea edulis]
MKIQRFEIHVDGQTSRNIVITSGTDLRGTVHVNVSQSLKVQSISLDVSGKGKCKFDRRSDNDKREFTAKETYVNYRLYLFGGSQTQAQTLEAGDHVYPFVIPLTTAGELPSSFEGRKGYVRYTLLGQIARPWKADETIVLPFTVINHLDLNEFPDAVMPIMQYRRQEITGCCCSEGEIIAQMKVNKSGFVPGEPIVVEMDINNKSETPVQAWTVELIQDVNYTGFSNSLFSSGNPKFKTKSETYPLYVNQSLAVDKGQHQIFTRAMPVPSLPPSYLKGCNIIDIQYTLSFKISTGWNTIALDNRVIIGSIPVRNVTAQMTQAIPTAPEIQDYLPPTGNQDFMHNNLYPDAPPSYSECVSGPVTQEGGEDEDDNSAPLAGWTPAYPVYDYTAQTNQVNASMPPTAPPAYDEIQFSNIR